jgi:hypothetical protein
MEKNKCPGEVIQKSVLSARRSGTGCKSLDIACSKVERDAQAGDAIGGTLSEEDSGVDEGGAEIKQRAVDMHVREPSEDESWSRACLKIDQPMHGGQKPNGSACTG